MRVVLLGEASIGRHNTLRSTTTGSSSSINIINTIISFLIDPNQSELYYPWPPSCCFFPNERARKILVVGYRIPAKFCSCNMSHKVHKVQQVELRATCRGDKIVARFVLHVNKSINSPEGRCRCNMSPQHFLV